LGFGKTLAKGISWLVLGTVAFGMPASSLIASKFISRFFGMSEVFTVVIAGFVLVVPAVVNFLGIRASSKVQTLATISLVVVSVAICGSLSRTAAYAGFSLEEGGGFSIANESLSSVLRATVLVFWAFAGFENLMFMAADFKEPRKDIQISMIVAIFSAGILYLALTYQYVRLVPAGLVDSKSGLYQLAELSSAGSVLVPVTVFLAILSVFLNFNSWFLGLGRLIQDAAKEGVLPRGLAQASARGAPVRAVCFLLLLQLISLCAVGSSEWIFRQSLRQVSFNFVFIYALMIFTVIRLSAVSLQGRDRILSMTIFSAVAVAFLFVMIQSAASILYPLVLFVLPGFLMYMRRLLRR